MNILYILRHNPWGIGGGCYACRCYLDAFIAVFEDAHFLSQWPSQTKLHLPESYNLFFKYLTDYHRHYGFKYGKNIKVVHFIGNKKPWHDKNLTVFWIINYWLRNQYGVKVYLMYQKLLRIYR